jgi:hypothetical protein
MNWLIRQKVCWVARSNLGFGEEGGNNRGRFIDAIGGKQGQEWCATFAGYCYQRAYEEVAERMPFERSQGAKRLTKNLGAVGHIWKPGERDVLPGDLVCWNRGVLGWTGHVGIVVEVDTAHFGDIALPVFTTIEGNVGGKVVMRNHNYTEPKLWRFAGLR